MFLTVKQLITSHFTSVFFDWNTAEKQGAYHGVYSYVKYVFDFQKSPLSQYWEFGFSRK